MPYRILFESTLPERKTQEIVRVLASLPLHVVSITDANGKAEDACPSVPVVTLGSCPNSLSPLVRLGPRGWVAILPAQEGETSCFLEAGAFAALRLPVERSQLLSTISRCLCAAGAEPAGAPHRMGHLSAYAGKHASGA